VKLTTRQHRIVEFLAWFEETQDYLPTIRQIADGVDLASTSSVWAQLRHLEKYGIVARRRQGLTWKWKLVEP
jgi:repressor LexA